MSVWRTVQETLYKRWEDNWLDGVDPRSPFTFANEGSFDPPDGLWAKVSVLRMPGGQETLGSPGNRKMNRVGLLLIDLREPAGSGVGDLADEAEFAAAIFENCRILAPYDIRFNAVEPGEASHIDKGRWWGVSVEGRFEYEDIR